MPTFEERLLIAVRKAVCNNLSFTLSMMSIVASKSSVVARKFLPVGIRSIATRTTPCLKRKGKNMAKMKLRRGRNDKIPTKQQTKAEYIEELKEKIEKEKRGELPPPVGFTPTTEGGGPPSISGEEFLEKITHLDGELYDIIPTLSNEHRERMELDALRIRLGKLSMKETRLLIFRSLMDKTIDSVDRQRVEEALRSSEEYLAHTIDKRVSAETQGHILKVLEQPPPEEFGSQDDRLQALVLDEVPPYKKREILEKRKDLHFARQYDLHMLHARGVSMLPTLPEDRTPHYGFRITPDNIDQISVGHIVSFVVVRQNGQPGFMCKRIRALADDVVEYQGKRMTVPEGHFWAVGDNEPSSYDSSDYGAVPLSSLRFRLCFTQSNFPPYYDMKWLSTNYNYKESK